MTDKVYKCRWCKRCFSTTGLPRTWVANHSRWCVENPKRSDYVEKLKIARESLNSSSYEKISEAVKLAHSEGKYLFVKRPSYKGRKHSAEAIEKIRKGALKSKHRRLQRKTIQYKGVTLDSSWELALAKRLDKLGVEWKRPDPIPWTDDEGLQHNYFPDFYLPKYDIYLDPKNPAAFLNQKEKIKVLKSTYSNILFLKTLQECLDFDI